MSATDNPPDEKSQAQPKCELRPSSPTVESLAATLLALGVLPADGAGVPQELATKALGDLSYEISKKTKQLITWGSAAGGGAGLVGSIVAGVRGASDSVLIALVLGTAVILTGGVYGLARVLDGDVRGRSAVSTATVQARSAITTALLNVYFCRDAVHGDNEGAPGTTSSAQGREKQTNRDRPSTATLLSALAAFDSHVTVTTLEDRSVVHGVRWGDKQRLELMLAGEKWVPAEKVLSLTAKR